ncbi:N-acetylglucosaminyldiphosphoundecaprenol N-acetyl-beta-D-mannosaminyltransferase [Novosphingobium fluoreni]|uniref:N-acetylglucosaminyldiphosphoundecaprenol N-acetyl-beta-D-mannosaminyltransferase n=1 Tax=Novosphingobium fluoreni TaxID=1391222 RepID=A0A7W6BZG9_9SPHN|nr:WecB/TagA/CpsF family glycosyltransferase [Novosphingobium fluoreni]MBB3938919.1 N-acetylglucosaminyldiphosphoundecaprenol N-acetyl-beta-D-mannosaminyltransferase [Novosphingobium fluoreni]
MHIPPEDRSGVLKGDSRRRSVPDTFNLFGVDVSITSSEQVCELIESWACYDGEAHSVAFPDTHALVKAHDNDQMCAALADADVVCPDGHPIAFLGRWLKGVPANRTCGPDTMLALCRRSPKSGLRHYFYGAGPGVAEKLADEFKRLFPGIKIVGAESPPMRPLTPEEDAVAMDRILKSRPNVLWVGLGAPKQEIWMLNHKKHLPGVTLLAVGAAFDFHSGRIKRAPSWMRRIGMEWIYRAGSEPKRLGSRYLKVIPRFMFLASREIFVRR